jgi:hypothetical protein
VMDPSRPVVTGGTINGAAIGGTTRAAGAFTTLAANSQVDINPANVTVTINPTGTGTLNMNSGATGALNNVAIGGTTPSTAAFTTMTATTSITIAGGSALSVYSSGTWTPVVAFATPGDLSVSYGTRNAHYVRIGTLVFVSFDLTFTPTFTTGSGAISISGLPYSVANNAEVSGTIRALSVTRADEYVTVYAPSSTTIGLLTIGTTGSAGALNHTNFPTGVAHTWRASMVYQA